jgi:hypothetical protein
MAALLGELRRPWREVLAAGGRARLREQVLLLVERVEVESAADADGKVGAEVQLVLSFDGERRGNPQSPIMGSRVQANISK